MSHSGLVSTTSFVVPTWKSCVGNGIVIAGPSGSRKSTMIRCINRLDEHHPQHERTKIFFNHNLQ
ncbi:hypothetical protein D9M69_03810 [compost metagenome]